MTKAQKEELYDEICWILTDFETSSYDEGPCDADFYDLLVKIQNSWEGITSPDE